MLVIKEYNRDHAIAYARRWALDRNPLFFSFNGQGGDCTNFTSQCVFAGGCVMNYTPVYGWYYISSNDRTPSWSGVEFFYDFITKNTGPGPFASVVEPDRIVPGDLVQLQNDEGRFYHTVFVLERTEDGDFLIAAHSDDYYERRLSEYNVAGLRYLHIEGIRFETQLRDFCFQTLLSGGIEPFEETETPPEQETEQGVEQNT